MNKIIRLALVLFAVSAIVAGVLGVVNALTAPVIDAQKQAKTAAAFASILEAERYDEIDFSNPDFPTVLTVHKAGDAGYVVTSKFSGAQGNITMAVGVDNDFKCTGIAIIEHAENAASTGDVGVNFREQFVGQDESIALSNNGGSIDALTGATITSRAITEAVATSIWAVESLG